jgi:hypothetical protein
VEWLGKYLRGSERSRYLLRKAFVAGVHEHEAAADVKNFRIGAGDQLAVYGERVAPVANSVNATLHEY